MNVPYEYVDAYKKCRHYKEGDKVIDIIVGIDRLGSSFMNLLIEDSYFERWQLPFYYNQLAGDCIDDDFSEKTAIRENPDAWVSMMAGATNWEEWFDYVDLE